MSDQEQEQAAAFAQAFNGEPTGTPGPEKAEQVAAPAPAPEYVQITREDFDRINQAVARLPEFEQAFSRKVDTAFGKIGVIEQGLKQGGALTDEDLAPFKDDLPEIYAALKKVRAPSNVEALLEERTKPYAERLDQVTTELRETQQATVAAVHPDWQAYTQGEEFRAWLGTKDAAYQQQLGSTWSPHIIVSALNEAKQTAAKAKQSAKNTRQAVVQAAVQPRGTGGRYVAASDASEEAAYLQAWK